MPSDKLARILAEINTFSLDEMVELILKLQDMLQDKGELLSMLKAIQPTFADWDNDEDDAYNDL